jgi:hypothetical protein
MRYLSILLAVLFVGWIMTSPVTVHAKHGCPGSGHGSDPSGGHGQGHGDGGGGGNGGGSSGGNVGGGSSGGADGDVDRSYFTNEPNCTVVEWWNNGFSCPEPIPYIPAE